MWKTNVKLTIIITETTPITPPPPSSQTSYHIPTTLPRKHPRRTPCTTGSGILVYRSGTLSETAGTWRKPELLPNTVLLPKKKKIFKKYSKKKSQKYTNTMKIKDLCLDLHFSKTSQRFRNYK